MKPTVFVLGASGFIGGHLAQGFHAAGWRVIGGTRSTAEGSCPFENLVSDYVRADDYAKALTECSLVIHAASTTTPGSSIDQPLRELDSNLRPTLALLEALQHRSGIRVLYISSAGTLYADRSPHSNEQSDLMPRSYHGAAKGAAEMFIKAWAVQCDASAVILRPSNVYGPRQPAKPGFGIIPTAFDCICRDTPFTVWGDGSARRDYLYVADLFDLCLRVAQTPTESGVRTYNAASGQSVTVAELLSAVERITGKVLKRVNVSRRAVDADYVLPDNSAARRCFGWSPSTTLQAGLEQTWQWIDISS